MIIKVWKDQLNNRREIVIKKIKKFIELSVWFNRKSQHYILGNWSTYTDKFTKKYFNYVIGYPKAWFIFMWLCRYEIIEA